MNFTVIRPFDALSSTELSLNVGDAVVVENHDEAGGWSYGMIGGHSGWFPTDHVTLLNDQGKQEPPFVKPKPKVTPTNNGTGMNMGGDMRRIIDQLNVRSEKSVSKPPPIDQINVRSEKSKQPLALPPSVKNIGYVGPHSPGRRTSHNYEESPPTRQRNGYSTSNGGRRISQPVFFPTGETRLGPPIKPLHTTGSPPMNGVSPRVPMTPPPRLPMSNKGPSPPPKILPTPASPTLKNSVYTFQFCVEALYPYSTDNREQLNFAAKEKLDIIEKPTPGGDWWRARNKTGEMGLVPKNYVKEKPQATPVLAERLWYKYRLGRESTLEQMRNKPTECYVIRDSEAFPGCFTLSVKGPDKVRHIKITTVSDGYEVGDKKFASLDAVVDFYRNSPIYIADNEAYRLFLSKPLV